MFANGGCSIRILKFEWVGTLRFAGLVLWWGVSGLFDLLLSEVGSRGARVGLLGAGLLVVGRVFGRG